MEGGDLIAIKPMYAGKFSAKFRLSSSRLQVVTVRSNLAQAAPPAGSQFLALRGGQLSRSLPTVAARNYRLSYSVRLNQGQPRDIVAWWPAEDGVASDIIGGHTGFVGDISFVPGMAGDAFEFDGVDDQISVPDAPGFVCAVQWHPEAQARENPLSMKLFDAFTGACRFTGSGASTLPPEPSAALLPTLEGATRYAVIFGGLALGMGVRL